MIKKQSLLLMVIMVFISSGFKTVEMIQPNTRQVDLSLYKERVTKLKMPAPNKNYTEGACTVTPKDTATPAKAGTMCFETTGRCKAAKECTVIAGQINGIVPTLTQIQTMADNHGQLMYAQNFIDYEDIPFSVSVAYNSLKTFYGYP